MPPLRAAFLRKTALSLFSESSIKPFFQKVIFLFGYYKYIYYLCTENKYIYIKMNTKLDIRRAIQEHGMTINSVAQKAGLAPQSIQQFINGNPSVEKLFLLADAIGCDVRKLFFSPDDVAEENASLPSVHYCPHCGTKFQILENS